MKRRPDRRGMLLSAALVCFFLFLSIFMVDQRMPSGDFFTESRETVSVSGDYRLYIEDDGGSPLKTAAADIRTIAVNVRRLKENIIKFSLIIHLFFSAWVCFSLWGYLKRAFFSCLQSCCYHLARFLNDLMIQWAKDGKKERVHAVKFKPEYW